MLPELTFLLFSLRLFSCAIQHSKCNYWHQNKLKWDLKPHASLFSFCLSLLHSICWKYFFQVFLQLGKNILTSKHSFQSNSISLYFAFSKNISLSKLLMKILKSTKADYLWQNPIWYVLLFSVSYWFPNKFWKHVTLVLSRQYLPSLLMNMLYTPPSFSQACSTGFESFFLIAWFDQSRIYIKMQMQSDTEVALEKCNSCMLVFACLWGKPEWNSWKLGATTHTNQMLVLKRPMQTHRQMFYYSFDLFWKILG